ncbi:MAG: isocitrate lyase/phosphoenolpyruvate mutase family protein [Kiloniellales bacterium]|nr:isocitrate lyase/phosphoenolpyruvate mutase family protein [Kiloniellales bacterium]
MPTLTLFDKAEKFRKLHLRPNAFVIPNPWDIGSLRILEASGFEAIATTSAGFAFTIGRQDGAGLISRSETIAHAQTLAEATELPVSADLENGFGDEPEAVATTILLAAEAGLVGGSIEDATGRQGDPIYDFGAAVERIAAASEAARSLPFPFTLTARCENFLFARPDLEDTIRRLKAYEEAGADVLYAPGLPDLESIRSVCEELGKPVNVVMGIGPTANLSVDDLAEAGVKRISLGSALARAAVGAFLQAVTEIKDHGRFTFTKKAASFREIAPYLTGPKP